MTVSEQITDLERLATTTDYAEIPCAWRLSQKVGDVSPGPWRKEHFAFTGFILLKAGPGSPSAAHPNRSAVFCGFALESRRSGHARTHPALSVEPL